MAIAALYAILVPAYGALLDPTFAERLPWHTHAAPIGSHVHAYDLPVGIDVDGSAVGATPGADAAAASAADGLPSALAALPVAGAAAALFALAFLGRRALPGPATRPEPPPPRIAHPLPA